MIGLSCPEIWYILVPPSPKSVRGPNVRKPKMADSEANNPKTAEATAKVAVGVKYL